MRSQAALRLHRNAASAFFFLATASRAHVKLQNMGNLQSDIEWHFLIPINMQISSRKNSFSSSIGW
jgi:hypothetical protein